MDEDNELKLDDIDVFSENSHLKLNLYSFVNKRFLTKYDKESSTTKDLTKSESNESTEKDSSKDSSKSESKDSSTKESTKSESKDSSTKESTEEDLVDSLADDLEEDPTELHNKSSTDDEPKPKPKAGVFEIETLRKSEVELNCRHLPGSADCISRLNRNLRAVERRTARILN